MRVTPKSEQEVQKEANKFGPWPLGTYDFEVAEASDEISSKGNEMIKLTLHVFNQDGERRTVFDYLLESIPHKLRHASEACGLLARYEGGQLDGVDFYGKTGRLKLGIQPEKDGYQAKNTVRDYIPAKEPRQASASAPASRRATAPAGAAADLDDEIPF